MNVIADPTPCTPEFRWASESDLPLVHECDELSRVDEGRRLELRRTVRQQSCLLAVRDGPLGFAVLEDNFFGHAFVSLICVATAHRGRGIGLQLMSQIERHCPGPKLFTSTNISNERARRLFAKAGFVPSGRIENLDDGDPECVYFKALTARDLPAPGNSTMRPANRECRQRER